MIHKAMLSHRAVLTFALLALGFSLAPAAAGAGEVVHIRTQADFDASGERVFEPGTVIAFARGRSFEGRFAPRGSGTAEAPIRVTAADPRTGELHWEPVPDKPTIHGRGKVNAPFYLYNSEYWEITNLKITNTDGTADDQGNLRGIHVVAEDAGVLRHIVIRNNDVRHVNGEVGGKLRGGIHVHVIGKRTPTRFDGVLIENNLVYRVGGVGIGNQSTWRDIDSDDYHPWRDLVIRNNRVERTGRNGIIVRNSIAPLVEYNTLAHNSRHSTGHSVFNFNTIDCVIQFNEAYGNVGGINDADRGGFDADWNSRGTIIQYNYSHGNHWFVGIMRRGKNRDITIRYNISRNDRLGAYFYGFPGDTGLEDVKVYNNTHYFPRDSRANIFANPRHPAGPRTPIATRFSNNIFYFEGSGGWGVEPDEDSTEFSHNLFYNVPPRGADYLTDAPGLVDPSGGGSDLDMRDPLRLRGFRLSPDSPAIGAGSRIDDHGGRDFWGRSLYHGRPDVGAHEYHPDRHPSR